MYIVAIAWVYVVLLMAITEPSVIAGIMTFAMYCIFPLTILLYLMRTPQRKRDRVEKAVALQQTQASMNSELPESGITPTSPSVDYPEKSKSN
ncbi:hypothetical protein ACO0K7_08475 [Undibacterium sp. Ji67W]|uniref:hypothetical protein n=1 Tax=Undibacterium sp. Ji67W TaxID=3413042 RepID=UPI003BF3F5E4